MIDHKRSVVSGVLIVDEDLIAEYVEEGILQPKGRSRKSWQFSQSNLRYALKARRLQRDLEINLAGVAVIIGLMEELESLRTANLRQPG